MKTIYSVLLMAAVSLTACLQGPEGAQAAGEEKVQASASHTIVQGTYLCWQNSPSSPGGMSALGDMVVKGNTYSGDMHGEGTYSYDPSSRIVRFSGGGLDQRKNGEEWIGIFYEKGDKFLDGSEGEAANTMLVITKLKDWEGGFKKAWIQQCDLK